MTRPLDPDTALAVVKSVLPLAAIVRLDVMDDPLFCWTGLGDLVFAAAETGDSALDTFTFKGTGLAADISTISEGVGGSDVLEIAFPGVDLDLPMLRQLLRDRRRWQFRRAWVWLMALDPDTDLIAGKPFRVKTGRMDNMPYSENSGQAIAKVRIEGQQSYGDQALGTRYSEQPDINPLDISQKFAYSLANMTAALGQASATPGTGAGASTGVGMSVGSSGGGGGSPEGRFTGGIGMRWL